MITEIFEGLAGAVSGTPIIAILASLAWGALSIILSPCHLASIPLIIGFIGEQGVITTRRAFSLALLFSLGILATIGLIGVATAAFGRMLGDLGPHMNYIVAVIFFVIGLHFLGVIPMPFSAANAKVGKRRGALAAFGLGLVFGLALGPCTFAYMAPMLGITLSVARTNMGYGILLLMAYGVGHCSIIVAAGTFTEVVEHYLKWSGRSRGLDLVKKVCGILVIIGGVYLIWIN
ncbi:cytochrome c biogenesis CcdA family protein [Candidatus Eisenbacteria bacterium]|uniref:Cytochrome c biogenesis CcdA family protein n=1 Tax=Eiseniibacteriota bacterium TaxID=2212470 RepID=A0ABV6YPS4_UNCEI